MKLFGYVNSEARPGDVVPASLAEVTVVASPAELRSMARFLGECADRMDKMGDTFDHEHLGDNFKEFCDSPELAVARDSAA